MRTMSIEVVRPDVKTAATWEAVTGEAVNGEAVNGEAVSGEGAVGEATTEEAAALFLATLPGATPARLRRLLGRWQPTDALHALRDGAPEVAATLEGCTGIDALRRDWATRCKGADLPTAAAALHAAATRVWWPGDARWESTFGDDPSPPGVLFVRGQLDLLARPRVAVIGTRSATSSGLQFAGLLGRELCDAGVAVVSGLALGIDGAAHVGVLRALDAGSGRDDSLAREGSLVAGSPVAGSPVAGGPVAVVGSGLDVVYPRAHARLWERVAGSGLLLSESPPGRGPTPASFPQRNRIIAQLATVLVVVESHEKGGSLITVDRALERGRRVLAVPGSPLSRASVGTNALLRGVGYERPAIPCLGTSDVLALLDLDRTTAVEFRDPRPDPTPTATELLALMGWEAWPIGRLVRRAGRSPSAVTLLLASLEADGWVARTSGSWHRLAAAPW